MTSSMATNDLMATGGRRLRELWDTMQAAVPARDGKRACALANRILDNRRKFAKPGAVIAEAMKRPPEAGQREWKGFFEGFAAFIAQIAPLFIKA